MSARIKAFVIHIITSVLIATFAALWVFFVWYPAPLAQAVGVLHVFFLMLAIDVIVGPLFTLLVYKTGKKSLKFDLTVIIFMQLAIFSYGLHTVALGRPAWLVFSTDQFYLVRSADLDSKNQEVALPVYKHTPWFGPQWVAISLPEDKVKRKQLVLKTLKDGDPLFTNPTLYSPLTVASAKIQFSARPLSELQQFNSRLAIETSLAKFPNASSWLPLWSNPKSMTVLLDKDHKVVSVVNLNPVKQ